MKPTRKPETRLDHLVIAAADLDQGVAYVRDTLGVDIPAGGIHPAMGTHNHLMQLGNDTFLEVIAVNPDMAGPDRPRWFGLDDPFVRQRLAAGPKLAAWVVNTPDIRGLLGQTRLSLGDPTRISRGDLSWFFSLPRDGRLLVGGMLPYVIQWETAPHPARNMGDPGCRLLDFDIHHPCPDWIEQALAAIGCSDLMRIRPLPRHETPYLTARISTPDGVKELSGA